MSRRKRRSKTARTETAHAAPVTPVTAKAVDEEPEQSPTRLLLLLWGIPLVIVAVALRRLTLAANKLWTKRYIQSTIPTR